jgi:hypothetical protein
MEYVCNFLNHNNSYVGPSVTICRSNLDGAIEEALQNLASYPEYHGFDLLEDGERKHRFKRSQWTEDL